MVPDEKANINTMMPILMMPILIHYINDANINTLY